VAQQHKGADAGKLAEADGVGAQVRRRVDVGVLEVLPGQLRDLSALVVVKECPAGQGGDVEL
jgi:hypothetical protein